MNKDVLETVQIVAIVSSTLGLIAGFVAGLSAGIEHQSVLYGVLLFGVISIGTPVLVVGGACFVYGVWRFVGWMFGESDAPTELEPRYLWFSSEGRMFRSNTPPHYSTLAGRFIDLDERIIESVPAGIVFVPKLKKP